MTTHGIEFYVAQYGEACRPVIVEGLAWLDREAPRWGLRTPIDRDEFIADLIRVDRGATAPPEQRNEP